MFEEILEKKREIGYLVERRLSEFQRLKKEGKTHFNFRPFLDIDYEADIFSELCFCLLTANSSATLGIKLQKAMGIDGFWNASFGDLVQVLEKHGHRFARQRAERIVKAKETFPKVLELIDNAKDSRNVRDLLSNPHSKYKVEGFGMKEASHFLRNIGFDDVAIVDRHVFRFLKERGLLPDLKSITRRIYLQAEMALDKICEEFGMTQSELDLYIFYIKTGKVLK